MKQTRTGRYIQNELLCGYCNGTGIDAGQEACKPCRATGLETQKIVRVGDMRRIESMLNREEITYSRMVEMLNQQMTKFMYDWMHKRITED